mgnify:CR=1 FL=1
MYLKPLFTLLSATLCLCFPTRAFSIGKQFTEGQWGPPGRFSHSSIHFKHWKRDEIWIIGGSQKPNFKNRTCAQDANGPIATGHWRYSILDNKWLYQDIPFMPRRGATLVKNNRKVYLHGGGTVDLKNPFRSKPIRDMWEFKHNEWQKVEIQGKHPDLYCHQSVIDSRGYVYSMGGLDGVGRNKYLYTFDGKRWSKSRTPFAKTGIIGHTLTLVEDELIYIIGGVLGDVREKKDYNADVWTYNVLTGQWNLECGGIPIQGHCSNKCKKVVTIANLPYCDDDIIVSGGFYPTQDEVNDEGATHLGGTSRNIFSFNTRQKTWRSLGYMSKPREFHTAEFDKSRLYVFGGYHIGNFWDDGEIIYLE